MRLGRVRAGQQHESRRRRIWIEQEAIETVVSHAPARVSGERTRHAHERKGMSEPSGGQA